MRSRPSSIAAAIASRPIPRRRRATRRGIDAVATDDLLTIIYTSGTTGEPKGVMLTHGNLVSNIAAVIPMFELKTDDVALRYLPLSHVFERMVDVPLLVRGRHRGLRRVDRHPRARPQGRVRPTVMTVVPRVYEKLQAHVLAAVAEGPPVRRWLFDHALGLAMARVRRSGRAGREPLEPRG